LVLGPNTAVGDDVATGGTSDLILGLDSAIGGAGDDILFGTATANIFGGGGGADGLLGFAGNDHLFGGDGADTLIGGTGKDVLVGGSGPDGDLDTFVFTDKNESGLTTTTRDVIGDFEDGFDRIDLSAIDSNTTVMGNQAFAYFNVDSGTTPAAKFPGAPGLLRSFWTANGVIIEGDVNGDAKADFAIELFDPTHAIVLTNADFVL
jgi:serralysin